MAVKACGIVLAGGVSKRFSGDKALTLVEGRPMVRRVAEALHEAVDVVYISVRDKARGEQLLEVCKPYAEGYLVDLFDVGPLSGLLTAGIKVDAEVFLTASSDIPWITSTPLHRLLEQVEGFSAASAVWGNGVVETLVQAVQKSCVVKYVERFLNARTGLARPSDMLRSAEKLHLVHASKLTDNPLTFANVNTIEDLQTPKPRGPFKGVVTDSLVITEAAHLFAEAVDHHVDGRMYEAGYSHAYEGLAYLRHGVVHLASHSLHDAAEMFRRAGIGEAENLARLLARKLGEWMV
jgi:molybdopterin-guanine dinucleotide biosynthesis protein A